MANCRCQMYLVKNLTFFFFFFFLEQGRSPQDGVCLIVTGSLIKRCSFDHLPDPPPDPFGTLQTALLSCKVVNFMISEIIARVLMGKSKLESNWDRLRFTRSTKQFTTAAPLLRYLWRCRGLPVVLSIFAFIFLSPC